MDNANNIYDPEGFFGKMKKDLDDHGALTLHISEECYGDDYKCWLTYTYADGKKDCPYMFFGFVDCMQHLTHCGFDFIMKSKEVKEHRKNRRRSSNGDTLSVVIKITPMIN